jgi:hypothetical protein
VGIHFCFEKSLSTQCSSNTICAVARSTGSSGADPPPPPFLKTSEDPQFEMLRFLKVLFVTQEKSSDLDSADPRSSPMAVNLWQEIHKLKRTC